MKKKWLRRWLPTLVKLLLTSVLLYLVKDILRQGVELWAIVATVAFLVLLAYDFRLRQQLKQLVNELKQPACQKEGAAIKMRSYARRLKPLCFALNKVLSEHRVTLDSVNRFSSDIAHEIRTPLTVLKLQTHVAADSEEASVREAAFVKMLKSINCMSSILDQLLALSRLDHKESFHALSKVDLAQCVHHAVEEMAPQALEKNIEIGLSFNGQQAIVQGNVVALALLLRNLLVNAITYTPNDGVIQVDLRKNHKQWVLSVIDNGPGIAKKYRKAVLNPFFRLPNNKMSGSGLGLNIVARIVKLHRAHITLNDVDSSTGLAVVIAFPSLK